MIPGATYVPDYISPEQARWLMLVILGHPWDNQTGRKYQHYGYRYDYRHRSVSRDDYIGPIPIWLEKLAIRLMADGHFPVMPDQVIINRYKPGQGIGFHVDCVPCFTDTITTLSLGSDCVMDFRHTQTNELANLRLEKHSLLVLRGDARYLWEHRIPARMADDGIPRTLRLSITMRKVKV